MLRLKVGGTWLSMIAAYGPVTVEFGVHGLEMISWEMSPTFRHPLLRGTQSVQVYDGGVPLGSATLVEPGSTGEYAAVGVWRQAERALALNTSGVPTTVPDAAIAGAYSRGEISWNGTISAATWGGTNPDPKMTLAALLDGYADEQGLRWLVSPSSTIITQADPQGPEWVVPNAVAGRGLTPADDEFVTHLIGTYLPTATTYDTRTIGSADAANVFGRRTRWVDLTPMGVITAARADSVLTGMFLLVGARMGWAEGLELAKGQITTMGGRPAALEQVQALDMVRLAGTVDTSKPSAMPAYTDVVIGMSRYTDGSGQIQLTPVGKAARNYEEILTVAVEGS